MPAGPISLPENDVSAGKTGITLRQPVVPHARE
jgi:hypothetical protein